MLPFCDTTMEIFPRTPITQLPLAQPSRTSTTIPIINLSEPNSKVDILKACQDFGSFKVTNHGISMELINTLEEATMKFFSTALQEKEKVSSPNPLGYGCIKVGTNGDMSWVEYLVMSCNNVGESIPKSYDLDKELPSSVLREYTESVRKLTCKVLQLLGEALDIKPKGFFSNLVMDQERDDILRINHYPPCPEIQNLNGLDLVGFEEHTDPQMVSAARSNNVEGYQILLRDGSWVCVPPDQNSFVFSVGDCLQVMTNGRLKSMKHRVMANSSRSRLSMIYFAAPPVNEKITPLQCIMEEGEESMYADFTWGEYKKAGSKTMLAENRLSKFVKRTKK